MTDINTARHLAQADEAARFPWVQVRIDTVTTCARLLDTFTTRDQVEFSKLGLHTPWQGTAYYPSSRIRACSGFDGRCFCAGEVGSSVCASGQGVTTAESALACDAPATAGDFEVPHGNHGDHNFSATSALVSVL